MRKWIKQGRRSSSTGMSPSGTLQPGEAGVTGTSSSAKRTQSSSASLSASKCVGAQPCHRATHFGRSSVTHNRKAADMYLPKSAESICINDGGEPNMKSDNGDVSGGDANQPMGASRIA